MSAEEKPDMPSQPTGAASGDESAADMIAKVEARAAVIEAKTAAKQDVPTSEAKLDKRFVLDCLSRNKIGDAALFCALFPGKYVFVQEGEKFLYWAGHYWEMDKRSRRALADAERVCKAYQNAWAEANEEEGSLLHKLLTSRLRSLRGAPGRKELQRILPLSAAPLRC